MGVIRVKDREAGEKRSRVTPQKVIFVIALCGVIILLYKCLPHDTRVLVGEVCSILAVIAAFLQVAAIQDAASVRPVTRNDFLELLVAFAMANESSRYLDAIRAQYGVSSKDAARLIREDVELNLYGVIKPIAAPAWQLGPATVQRRFFANPRMQRSRYGYALRVAIRHQMLGACSTRG
jgi:hypothetical protein